MTTTTQVKQVKKDDLAFIVKDIMIYKLGLEEHQLKDDATLQDDLGIDSLDIVEMLDEISDKFDIRITDEESEKLTTVGAIIRCVRDKMK